MKRYLTVFGLATLLLVLGCSAEKKQAKQLGDHRKMFGKAVTTPEKWEAGDTVVIQFDAISRDPDFAAGVPELYVGPFLDPEFDFYENGAKVRILTDSISFIDRSKYIFMIKCPFLDAKKGPSSGGLSFMTMNEFRLKQDAAGRYYIAEDTSAYKVKDLRKTGD